MKRPKEYWEDYRSQIVSQMRYSPTAPKHACYYTPDPSRPNLHLFGGDTMELTERALKIAKSENRKRS